MWASLIEALQSSYGLLLPKKSTHPRFSSSKHGRPEARASLPLVGRHVPLESSGTSVNWRPIRVATLQNLDTHDLLCCRWQLLAMRFLKNLCIFKASSLQPEDSNVISGYYIGFPSMHATTRPKRSYWRLQESCTLQS